MERAIISLRQLSLLSGDIAVFILGLALAIELRGLGLETSLSLVEHLLPFVTIFLFWVVLFAMEGLYDLTKTRDQVSLIRELSAAMALAAAVSVVFFYLTPGISIAPKTTLFLDLAVTYCLLLAWRLLYLRFLGSKRLRNRILFVGLTDEARELISLLVARPHLGLDVVGSIVLDGSNAPGIPVRRTLEGFAGHLRKERVDTVVLAMSPRTSPELTRCLYESIFLKVSFVDLISFYEQITRRVPISAITHVWFLENIQESRKRLYEKLKRGSDIVFAILIGILTVVMTPAVAAVIWISDRGPIFYDQERIGRDGRLFRIKKFRTMVVDAEKDGAKFTEKEDSRVTGVGRLLRVTRIDELPQCWNILTGEMALIGPRPERPEFSETLTTDMPYYPMRLLVRPGLTGWAQVNHSYYATPEEHRLKLQYDLYYIKNRSFILDSLIVFKTLNTILRAKGQ